MPDNDQKLFLPGCYTKREIYLMYKEYISQLQLKYPMKSSYRPIAASTFQAMWDNDFDHVKIRKVITRKVLFINGR